MHHQSQRPFNSDVRLVQPFWAIRGSFSFFSDTFVEADGWYIDDAGIWWMCLNRRARDPSPVVPDPLLGYGVLDAVRTTRRDAVERRCARRISNPFPAINACRFQQSLPSILWSIR